MKQLHNELVTRMCNIAFRISSKRQCPERFWSSGSDEIDLTEGIQSFDETLEAFLLSFKKLMVFGYKFLCKTYFKIINVPNK